MSRNNMSHFDRWNLNELRPQLVVCNSTIQFDLQLSAFFTRVYNIYVTGVYFEITSETNQAMLPFEIIRFKWNAKLNSR